MDGRSRARPRNATPKRQRTIYLTDDVDAQLVATAGDTAVTTLIARIVERWARRRRRRSP